MFLHYLLRTHIKNISISRIYFLADSSQLHLLGLGLISATSGQFSAEVSDRIVDRYLYG